MSISREKSKDEVIQALHNVASEMHDKMSKGNPPTMTLPVRSKSNIGFDQRLGVYKYGKKRTVRDATNLGSAKQLLRSLHVTEFIEDGVSRTGDTAHDTDREQRNEKNPFERQDTVILQPNTTQGISHR